MMDWSRLKVLGGLSLLAGILLAARKASGAGILMVPPTGGGDGGVSAWNGDVKAMQAKLNQVLGMALDTDGKAGTQTCKAAERAVLEGKADADIAAFAKSAVCGGGMTRAPCGVTGPVASAAVMTAVLDAAVAKGYPRGDVAKAIKRESGNKPMAVACGGSPNHAIAGGLLQFIPITLKAVGFQGSPDQFAGLTGEQQLPYLLKFLGKMPPSTRNLPGDFGLALFTPAWVGEADDFVIYDRGTLGWEQNPGLRSNGGGPITAGSVRATAR